MGNAIKNFEKKRRKEQKEAYREIRKVVHDIMMENINLPKDYKKKKENNTCQL